VIERNARLQHQMLEDLLDISRLIHGKLLIRPRASDLWQLALQAVRDSELSARQRKMTVRLEPPPDMMLPIMADPRRIAQAIGDLLENALKFTDPGGVITVTGARQDAQAVLAIHDTGRGIPPEQLPQLFEPFKQIQRTEQTGGLGLGLMLVKGIISLHGGRVTADSPGLGQGSTFTIYIPLADADHADTSAASPSPTPTAE
ncbi:MAG TPA: HAMP domain-containing sensor histidine kinase, partial [Armatimonadota bacterium]